MRFSYLFKTANWGILLLIATDIVCILLTIASFTVKNQFFIIISTFVMLFVAYLTFNFLKNIIKGEEGESVVRKELEKLPETFYHLNDFVDGKKGNADLVVVGPTGIWTIEVKNYKADKVIFKNGKLCYESGIRFEKDGLSQAYAESKELERFLVNSLGQSFTVNPVLVFANKNTRIRFGLKKLEGVYVIGIDWISKLLQEQSNILNPEQCIKISDAIKKQTSII